MFFGLENLPLAQFNFSGGVGNIVAAALETKGLIDQAAILTTFKEQLEWIAAAAWLFSICMGLGAVAVFGNYKQGTYLLLGPPLFYYMVNTTIQTDGAKVIFGDRKVNGAVQDQKDLLQWIRTIDEGNKTVNVSFFFGVYDSVITEVVQSVVKLMLDTKNMADLRYVARETVLSHVLLSVPGDPDLASLILTYNIGTCGDSIVSLVQELERREVVHIRERNNQDIDYATKKTLEVEWEQKDVSLPPNIKRYVLGLKTQAQAEGVKIPFKDENDQSLVTCEEIWNFTRVALLEYAKSRLNDQTLQGVEGGNSKIPLKEAVEDVKKWLKEGAGAGKIDAEKVLAALIYKNIITRMTPAALQSQVFSRSPMNTAQYEAVFGDVGSSEAYGGFMKMKYFAASVPYIQGLMLYLLSIAFPFFAVFLVLPGKAPSFLVWCSLWAWVKSWDVGFAVVHVARDIFWNMMKHRANLHDAQIEWNGDPTSVIRFAFQNDPLFNQNMYWIIVSALTCMVPFVTAHLAMGANGMVDMFKGSIDQVANRFGQTEGNAARRHQSNITERLQFEQNARFGQRAAARAHSRYDGAKLLNGTAVARQDLRQGVGYGAMRFNPETNQLEFGNAVTDARGAEIGAAASYGQMALQNRSHEYLDGGGTASQTAATDLEKQNIAANKAAQGLESKIIDGTATDEDQKKYQELRKQNGLSDNQALVDQMKQTRGKQQNGQALSQEDQAKLQSELQSEMAQFREQSVRLPEVIPHMDRGMIGMNEELDQQSLEAYASDHREMAALNRQYGRENDAVRHEERAQEIEAMMRDGKTISWGEYYKEERAVADNYQNRLVVDSRRRQFLLKRSAGRDVTLNYLNSRQNNTLDAKGLFDGATNITNLAVPYLKENLTINPYGAGIKSEGTWFKGTGLSSVSGVGGDQNQDGGDE